MVVWCSRVVLLFALNSLHQCDNLHRVVNISDTIHHTLSLVYMNDKLRINNNNTEVTNYYLNF